MIGQYSAEIANTLKKIKTIRGKVNVITMEDTQENIVFAIYWIPMKNAEMLKCVGSEILIQTFKKIKEELANIIKYG